MKGLLMMLKAFGLSDEDIKKIQIFIPQVPTVASDVINKVNEFIVKQERRQGALEFNQEALRVLLVGDMSGERERFINFRDEVTAQIRDMRDRQIEQNRQILEVLNGIRSGQLQRADSVGDINGTAIHSGADNAYSGGGAVASNSVGSGVRRKRGNR
jgi:hypothetical protein